MKVTIVTTMRNEGAHLLEWIAYHRAVGVSNFLVYTNDCDDSTEALLDLLPDVVRVSLADGEKPPQWRALRAAWDHPSVQRSDWLSCIDCDEFININRILRDIPHLISEVGGDAISLPWRLFGNNDEVDLSDRLTLERFTTAAPADMLYPAIGSYFKTLFRREGPFRQFGVHRPKQKKSDRHGKAVWSDGSGAVISGDLAENCGQIMNWGQPIANKLVQLNHYSVRSVSDFMVKRSRGLPNHRSKSIDLTYWVERNFNSVEDKIDEARVDATRAQMTELRNTDGVVDAEAAAKSWAAAKVQELLRNPDELALFGRIILAGSSQPPDKQQALELIRAYQVVHG